MMEKLEKLTAQFIFDEVARHILAQGCPCYREAPPGLEVDGIPVTHLPRLREGALRSPTGLLLRDEEYAEGLEGVWVHRQMLPARLLPYAELLHDLEAAHDGPLFRGVEAWRAAAGDVARAHGLSAAEIERLSRPASGTP
jgi:hypothetical protein